MKTAATTTTTVRNGVRVTVTRNEFGSTVKADCLCFGSRHRIHSSSICPNRKAS